MIGNRKRRRRMRGKRSRKIVSRRNSKKTMGKRR
jgi:hypothetical protein